MASSVKKALMNSRIFSDCNENLIMDIAENVELKTILGGDMVFAQGDMSDSMMVLVSGRLVARLALPDGTYKTLSHISPGGSAGELGLILQQPRAASVVAVRDSCIALLSKARFDALLCKYAVDMNRAITRTVFEYNTTINRPAKHVSATVITLVNVHESPASVKFCKALADDMQTLARVAALNESSLSIKNGNVSKDDDGDRSALIHRLEQEQDYLILETTNRDTAWSRLIARQSDHIVFVTNSVNKFKPEDINRVFFQGNMTSEVRKSLVCLHPENSLYPVFNEAWKSRFRPNDIYPVRTNNKQDLARLCRFLTDSAVGLVLGGGGARGLAHIGVIKALEEQDIPVDVVCGNSMGALIGALYATGVSTGDLVSHIQNFVSSGEIPTLPVYALLSGKKIKKNLKAMFGEYQLEAMWRPFFCVSCNLSKAEIHVHEEGELYKAVLASNSPAGVLPPVIHDGSLLVDAALLENVPVEALRKRLRFGTVFAVDVDVSEELSIDPDIEGFEFKRGIKDLLSRKKHSQLPGIIDILNRAGHLGGLARRKQAIEIADHYLQPPVSEFGLMAYKRSDEIVKTGYQYTLNQIQNWRKS